MKNIKIYYYNYWEREIDEIRNAAVKLRINPSSRCVSEIIEETESKPIRRIWDYLFRTKKYCTYVAAKIERDRILGIF